ncbi:hypothetical protein PIB30_033655 [Stylosanthes scabra]|uniref:Uncharacterized protein n=1 Tax=Stylosanthes scabra TaxID=79078 RepID=A0ABU6TEF7_9FABA|nr:hypothetical protein [Stylosanthes scabra]
MKHSLPSLLLKGSPRCVPSAVTLHSSVCVVAHWRSCFASLSLLSTLLVRVSFLVVAVVLHCSRPLRSSLLVQSCFTTPVPISVHAVPVPPSLQLRCLGRLYLRFQFSLFELLCLSISCNLRTSGHLDYSDG